MPDADFVMVLLDEFIRSDNSFAQHSFAGLDVIRVNIGQCLKQRHGGRYFSDTADVLFEICTVFGIAQMVNV